MTKVIVIEHNVSENKIIEREATAEEIAILEADKINFEQEKAKAQAQAAAKAALLERLGITEEEAKLLLG